MNLAQWLARSARRHGERVAIGHGVEPWCSYAALARRASGLATWLRNQGVRPGDRVGLFLTNRPEYLVMMWGVWWAGAAVVPINAKLCGREAAWILQHSGAQLAFVDPAQLADLADAGLRTVLHTELPADDPDAQELGDPVERSDTDSVWLFYTSGTTGRPKGVVLAARQLRLASLAYLSEVQRVAAGDVMLHPAPLSHGGGLYHLLYVMHAGVNVVPASGGFDPAEIVELAAHWRNASFFAAPTMVRRLVDHVVALGRRPEGLATITYGGGPMYLADIERALQVIGPHFAQIYGQGESPMTITVLPCDVINDTAHPRHRERLASVGHVQPMLEVSIRSDEGAPLPVGDLGEVCVRGDTVMQGYWQQPDATAAAIRDGWLYTGDVGRLDDEGFLTLLDRSKDLIISGGSNIYPREVEEVLLQHPAVQEASVIGRRDDEWGELVVAYVVARTPVQAAELDAFCQQHIARFKRPRHYRFVEALPKNHYGKVLKTDLRELDARQAGAARAIDVACALAGVPMNADPSSRWKHDGVCVVPGNQLDPNTAQTPGMDRKAAITFARVGAQKLWAGTVHIHPDAKTGAHHHGPLESVIFVLKGRARMRWGERLEFTAEAGPGDFIYVPPFVPHQEINASATEVLECVLVRSDGEAVAVNLDIEPIEKPESVAWIDSIHRA